MDDSQSSDFLSESIDYIDNSPVGFKAVPYEALIQKTKKLLKENVNGVPKSSLSAHFTSLLDDCSTCISQTLDLIIGLLVDSDIHYRSLTEYMEHAVCLLQMLSNYIKAVVESVSMSCCNMRTFPATTGNIIMAIFSHCRDSETLYGKHLRHVEKQLKDIFRTCHELQLTYLMVLEKHFTFDLTEKEEQNILIKALDINLTIGEIVQTLDVKTMAEQWKAYTMICEKHSNYLNDKEVFYKCTEVLCKMTINNIRNAIQTDQGDKIVIRSLKVASFTIKILLKLCVIFKLAVNKNYSQLMDFFLYVKLNTGPYLELMLDKSPQFTNQLNATVTALADALLTECALDEKFIRYVADYNVDSIRNEDVMLGYILLIVSIMEIILSKTDNEKLNASKHSIINCIFDTLPSCHIWFSLGLKFPPEKSSSQPSTIGLYEHVLIHTTALSFTLDSEQYGMLEQKMYEAILGTDSLSALFASDLWVMISRNNRQLLLEQFVFLCKTYQRLENNRPFHQSPQQNHLSYTIARLFETMKTDDKLKVYSRYKTCLWNLQINKLPPEVQEKVRGEIVDDLLSRFQNVVSSVMRNDEELFHMCKLMKVASTCRFLEADEHFEDCVMKIWEKACPQTWLVLAQGDLNSDSLWYIEFMESLVILTKSMERLFHDEGSTLKILHVMSKISLIGNEELNIILLELLCQIAVQSAENNGTKTESLISQIFKNIFLKNDDVVNNRIFSMFKNYVNHKDFEYVVTQVFSLDSSLQGKYSDFLNEIPINVIQWRNLISKESTYIHKCVEIDQVMQLSSSGSVREGKDGSNFDFADIDSLFDDSDPEQPASKKAKYNKDKRIEEVIL